MASSTVAPTTPRGILGTGSSSSSGWGGAYDELEHVQDLQWPLSIRTYARMRHDPTLASVLAAYMLPIMSARWEIDPRGASPAMVQICADSLGLPVRGEPDEPGPVRRRGVKWIDHLRTALGILWAGHAAFEPIYDLSTGQAMLATLAERTQLSIAEIEVDDQGNLTQVTQYGDITKPSPPPLSADRLLWYVRNREGATWTGSSLLRPAFGPWLLKQDVLRAGATGVRRFSAGTPSVEWDPGVQPTQAQMTAAQAVASNVRVADSGGVAMPPGAHLRLVGVSGTYPDAMPYLRYLDEQMARMALTGILDLGSTQNGSRALGENFAQILSMAQQGTADQVAETATQTCVRLTDYNEGDGAASPAVACGAIGDDEQALAIALSQLIQAGAITLDDGLEDWLREVFRAPARTTSRTPPPAPGQPADPQPVTARRVAAATRATQDETTTPTTRPLTEDEQAALPAH